jgi:folate-binding protein YgfZ
VATQALPELDAQYRQLREGAGLLDRAERASLEVSGPDALEYLQGQVTNDVLALEPGTGCYAALLNPKGRILADMRVLARSREELWLDVEGSAAATALADLRMYKIGRRVEVADRAGERAILSLIGPRADAVAPKAPPAEEHSFVEVEHQGAPVLAIRTNVGIDLVTAADSANAVREAVLAAGAQPVSLEAAEIVRIESGRPRHGVDMSDDNLPAELGIVERAVSFTKGCYVGQEPVARMHYKGHPNRHLRGLRLSEPAGPGTGLTRDDKDVGRVTSATISPALGPIALALVRREIAPGEEISAGADGATAHVVELPFQG